jgi:hypothetical protein
MQYGLTAPAQRAVKPMSPSEAYASKHVFTWAGFWERWQRVVPGAIVLVVVGAIAIEYNDPAKPQSAKNMGMFSVLIGVALLLFLFTRLMSVWSVRLDDEGVTWFGPFGSRHRDWDEITAVYRTEKITIAQGRFPTRKLKLQFADGGSVTFDQSVSDFAELADSVQLTVAELLGPAKRAELEEHGQVEFGPVTLRDDGILMQREFFGWDGLDTCKIFNGHLVAYGRPRRTRYEGDQEVPLSAIPNYPILLDLLGKRNVLA